MSKWSTKNLDLLSTTFAGGTPSRAIEGYYGGNIPWVKSTEVNQDNVYHTSEFLTEAGLKSSNCKLAPEGAVLIAMYGATAGQVSQLRILAATNQAVLAIICGNELDSTYLYYILLHKKNEILYLAQGSGQPNLSKELLDKTNIPFPSLIQQQKIAKILSTVDNLIEKTQSLIDKYTSVKQGMMADLFTRGIDLSGTPETNKNYGQLRPSVTESPELYQKTKLGLIPKDWKVAELGDCCEVHNNRRKPISAEERDKIKGDFPYYGCTGVLDYINEFRLDGRYVIIGEDGDHFLKFARQDMTILIDGKFNVNNHAHVISGTQKCLTEWFHLYFVQRDITYYLTRQGAGRFKLKKETLLELPVLLPPVKEQVEIYSRYIAINDKQATEKDTLLKYQNVKNGLMHDLLTGKVRVN